MKIGTRIGALGFVVTGLAFAPGISQAWAGESDTQTAGNSDRLSYGSRAGMEVTITGRSGINSNDAVISLEHTRENAKEFCVQYNLDDSDQCVDKTLAEVKVQLNIKANCDTGKFTNVWGDRLTFKGPAVDGDLPYDIDAEDSGWGEHQSDYDLAIDNFKTLCPAKIGEIGRASPAANAGMAKSGTVVRDESSEQFSDENKVIYGEMTDDAEFCRFLDHRTLSNLFTIYDLNKNEYDETSRTVSDKIDSWMIEMVKHANVDNPIYSSGNMLAKLSLSSGRRQKIEQIFSKCALESESATRDALSTIFAYNAGDMFIELSLDFNGGPLKLDDLVVMASLSDGLIALEAILDGMVDQSAAQVSRLSEVATKNSQAQSSLEARLSDPAEILSDFYGAYKLVSICYDNRIQYQRKYVDESMMREARTAIKVIEQRTVSSSNAMSPNQIWDNSTATYPLWRYDRKYLSSDGINNIKSYLDRILSESVTREFSKELDGMCKDSVKMLAAEAGNMPGTKEIKKDF
ncbi:hypothetical protein LB545_23460 [Mesorhizobium sp. BR1-1-6]|uniref:hypothetical protein n=1 Tax=Mesorhizobium sp. BR1-1-6 TaxID=2876648 RepID=UPI001CD17A9B|nr:hypothetical protein [Mesorhizobium sp. BR1-1-6]MBZ9897277.1 hypothetical protein [Mesorhizobium sp. BR1-1-6]